jgi:molybdopterin/thiamine biosynthesis adenylyltransferase
MHPTASFDAERYSRQTRYAPLGPEGQVRLGHGRVAIVGCGALGSVTATVLARAGVGAMRLIDRDVPEISNLPRQILFDEEDVRRGLPKAAAAERRLHAINAAVSIDVAVADLTAGNADRLLADADVLVDGTDNFETRFLINEFACRHRIPWVYGGAIGAEGRVLAVRPGATACLRCLIPEPPAAGTLPTCDTAGIIGPAAVVVGAVQAAEVIRLLVGADRVGNRLFVCDLWEGAWRTVDLAALAEHGCPTCRGGDFPWLEGRVAGTTAALCGRDAVQVAPATASTLDLTSLAGRLRAVGTVTANPWMVRVEVEPGLALSVFADGRAIVNGTRDEARARGIVAKYLGA